MSARLRLLVPQGTINYILNPSARYATTGATATGSTLTRSLDEARFGVASYKVVTNGAVLREGFYYRVNSLVGIQDIISVSAYVRGAGTVRIRLIDNPIGKEWSSLPVELNAERWQRIEVTGRCSGSDDMRLYIETDETLPQAVTFYADGLQMERQEEATTYCDGDQPGCRWNLLEHGSQSIRDPYTREGGRWIDIAGPSCEAQNLYMTVAGGLGAAPIQSQIQPYAVSPGAYFQNSKVLSRPITLSFHAKRKNRARTNGLPSLRHLHKLRQQLFDVVKPDRTAGHQAITLEYQDGEIPLYLKVRYEGGLEGEWDVRNEFVNSFPLRLLAVSPFFTEDDREVDALNFRNTQTINYALQRVNGEWSGMNGGFNARVRDFVTGPRGEIVAVGEFTLANNDANAIDPMIFANYIAWWDGEKWNGYGSGANGLIRAAAFGPDGNLYVTGDFTSIGGVAANRAAYWDGLNWNAMGAGLDNGGYAVAASPNGDIYFGGIFTTPGSYVALWRNGTWWSLGANGGMNSYVYSIAISSDGLQVYLGGAFTDEFTSPSILELNYVAVYYPDFLTFYALGVGFDAAVLKLLLSKSGRLYAGGYFTESNDAELTLLYLAYWNGASWFPVGVGADDIVRDLDVSDFGNIVLGGDFFRVGGTDAQYAALWNNSTYVNLDVDVPAPVYGVAYDKKENIFLGPDGTTAEFAAITTIDNIGSAETNPLVYIVGPCTVRWIENQTSKKRIYIDLDIIAGEEVTIDFSQGKVTSNTQGNLAYAVNPGSDLRAWTLIPGENRIAVLMTADVAATVYISYIPRHWSADNTAITESL